MNLNIQKHQGLKGYKNNILQKLLSLLKFMENNEFSKNETDPQKLIESITNAKKEWIRANNDFDYAVDKDMIDYHTYKIKAYQARYEYLIRIAKERGIKYEINLNKR
jgi:hypothetical protein